MKGYVRKRGDRYYAVIDLVDVVLAFIDDRAESFVETTCC